MSSTRNQHHCLPIILNTISLQGLTCMINGSASPVLAGNGALAGKQTETSSAINICQLSETRHFFVFFLAEQCLIGATFCVGIHSETHATLN